MGLLYILGKEERRKRKDMGVVVTLLVACDVWVM